MHVIILKRIKNASSPFFGVCSVSLALSHFLTTWGVIAKGGISAIRRDCGQSIQNLEFLSRKLTERSDWLRVLSLLTVCQRLSNTRVKCCSRFQDRLLRECHSDFNKVASPNEQQSSAVKSLLKGKYILAVLPTGFGTSGQDLSSIAFKAMLFQHGQTLFLE